MPLKRSSQILTAVHSFTCRICGKSSDKESSIKRHERYCRKRLTYPAPPRRKSCIACIRAKSRCDSCAPACGPCQRKGRSCMYSSDSLPSRDGQLVLPRTRSSPEQQLPNAPTAVPIVGQETLQNTSINAGMFITFDAAPLSVAPKPAINLSSEPNDFGSAEYRAVTKVALRKSDMPSTLGPLEMPCNFSSRLLKPKKRQLAKTDLISKLISQLICSFPEREMNENSCPPFIHHSTFGRSTKVMSSDDPIIICRDIISAARKTRGDVSIWSAIASEQERIYDQRGSFDKWLHLSSAQAMTMYILMLAAEGESVLSHHPNLPITLLFTLGSNFEQLNQIHPGFLAAKEQSRDRPTWEDWIFAESKLRTAAVYFILELHFDVEFGLPCDRESDYKLEDVDLPAAKILWDAKNEPSWREEFELREKARDTFIPECRNEVRLKYGDLVRHNKQQCGNMYPDIQKDDYKLGERIDIWQKGMDEFGTLVALCGTMV
ncbi:hypothetical protein N431DRAFT_158922 [Stipitochalara longipes BDJ]|nr:hypothetical protein N431DRAFT_158922 [Stipitochalara longipes BDJ]